MSNQSTEKTYSYEISMFGICNILQISILNMCVDMCPSFKLFVQ